MGAGEEKKFLKFLVERRAKSMAGGGVKIKPSALLKVREFRELTEFSERYGGYHLRFHDEDNVQIDMREVADRFPNLNGIDLDSMALHSSSLTSCKRLRTLTVGNGFSEYLDLSQFKNLTFFGAGANNLDVHMSSKTIKATKLCGNWVNNSVLENVRKFEAVESVWLLSCPNVTTLNGLGVLSNLKDFQIDRLKNLEGLVGVEKLSSLEKLGISNCRNIGDFLQISKLTKLKWLDLENVGNLPNIDFCARLKDLEQFQFKGGAIADGRLSVLKQLPKLQQAYFAHKPHYDIKENELGVAN